MPSMFYLLQGNWAKVQQSGFLTPPHVNTFNKSKPVSYGFQQVNAGGIKTDWSCCVVYMGPSGEALPCAEDTFTLAQAHYLVFGCSVSLRLFVFCPSQSAIPPPLQVKPCFSVVTRKRFKDKAGSTQRCRRRRDCPDDVMSRQNSENSKSCHIESLN